MALRQRVADAHKVYADVLRDDWRLHPAGAELWDRPYGANIHTPLFAPLIRFVVQHAGEGLDEVVAVCERNGARWDAVCKAAGVLFGREDEHKTGPQDEALRGDL